MSTASFPFKATGLPLPTIGDKDSTRVTAVHDSDSSDNTLGLDLGQPGFPGWTASGQSMDYSVRYPSTINGNEMWTRSQLLTGIEGTNHPRQALVEPDAQTGKSGLPSSSHSIQQGQSSHDLEGITTPSITPDRKKSNSKEGRKRQMYRALPLSPQKALRKATKKIRENYRRCEYLLDNAPLSCL